MLLVYVICVCLVGGIHGALEKPTDCGNSTGCYSDCDDTCTFVVTWKENGANIDFTLALTLDTDSDQWIALGLSDDQEIGSDSVTECVRNGDTVEVRKSYNAAKNNGPLSASTDGLSNTQGSVTGGVLRCSYTLKPTTLNQQIFSLIDDWYLLVANGVASNGFKSLHSVKTLASPNKADFQSTDDITGIAKPVLVKIHVDGEWLEWQAWQECSVTCGGGEMLRVRVCKGKFFGGAECEGDAEQTEPCGFAPCPIPGLWRGWSDWTLCTETCGGGVRYRKRTCDMTSFGNLISACEGDPGETTDCHTFACLPLAINCADWALRGLNQSTYADVDPDGEGTIYEGVVVECDFDTEPGKAVTVIHHDHENRTQVRGYEGAGEYQILLDYFMGWGEAVAIIDGSDECAQFMRWECLAAVIRNPDNPELLTTFWMNRTGHLTNYFGGATPGSGNCACGETNSCANAQLPCNCDMNDDVWRVDEGFVTNKAELPIMSFYAGDTGSPNEAGKHTIGPVVCH